MFFHIRIFLYSLIFFIVARFMSSDSVGASAASLTGWPLILAGFFFSALLLYFYRIAKRVSRKSAMTPMPVLFALSTWILLCFVQSVRQQYILIALGSIAYYFILIALYRLNLYAKDQTARGIIAAGSLATIFLFYAAAYGIYLNFEIPLWALILTLMAVTTLVSFQYLSLISENGKNTLIYSLVLGFAIAEIAWVMNFWPFGYLTTGVITLIFYYVFWDLAACHFLDGLTKKRIAGNMVFFGILVALVLSTARWLPMT